jgi:hypothetical protein
MRCVRVSPIILLSGFSLFLLSGCLDITTASKVNSDGSVARTIAFTGDSAAVYAGKFPIEIDSSWTRTVTKIQGQKNNFTLSATRTFHNVDEMNNVLKGTFGKTLQYRFELDKSFRWFFTVYRYRETNIPFDQFTALPITDFLSGSEIDWLTRMMSPDGEKKELPTRGDSLALEGIIPRIQEAEWRNVFEAVFNGFLDGVRRINDPSLTPTAVESFKDSLYKRSAKAIDKKDVDTLRFIFASVLKNPAVHKAWQANAAGFEEIKRKIEFEERTNSNQYVTNVAMPGIITGSNARKIEGNVATWIDFKDYAHHIEYTMWVESRQVNWWAVIVALVVVVALMAGLILSVARRRTRAQ